MLHLTLKIMCVFLGGALGSCLRFWVREFCLHKTSVPGWGAILIVNLLGSLVIGFSFNVLTVEMLKVTLQDALQPNLIRYEIFDLQLLAALTLVGFCGGLTTFSSFSLETVVLVEQGKTLDAIMNVLLSVVLGLLAVIFGLLLGGMYENWG